MTNKISILLYHVKKRIDLPYVRPVIMLSFHRERTNRDVSRLSPSVGKMVNVAGGKKEEGQVSDMGTLLKMRTIKGFYVIKSNYL